jgi:hypothetical protein
MQSADLRQAPAQPVLEYTSITGRAQLGSMRIAADVLDQSQLQLSQTGLTKLSNDAVRARYLCPRPKLTPDPSSA